MNPAGAKLFGAESPEQLVGKSVWDFVPPGSREMVMKRYQQMREKGQKAPSIEQKLTRLGSLPVELILTPQVESLSLPADIDLQLLRITQESLTNVRKHASASNADVSLQIDDGILKLTISDDGKGFSPDDVLANHQPHFGLSTMRERAEAIGAEFRLDSELETGTCVAVWLAVKDLAWAEQPKEN